ncbi:CynX/NimT family MFS transporter [Nocardioides alkalitolerans]|uniref:MFS transporter n=1 Tax=Nocardioides alkalitolerans TaxID=281714 RepID=UPI0004213119|nr:MFS transporter [Nocardioides alkalitolerans]
MSQAPIPAPAPADGRSTVRPSRLPAWLIVVLVGAIGLNLRASLGSVPPLLDDMNRDLHLSSTAAGLLTALAVVFMGLCAPLGQRLGARIGAEVATGLMMALLAVAGVVRLVPLGAPLLFASVALAGAAMGGASALMPSLIGHHVPSIRGFTMGIYSAGLAMGVAIAAGTAVPLEHLLGGWRPALATWGVISAVTAAAWLLITPALRGSTGSAPEHAVVVDHRMPWRSRTAWWVTLFSTSQMIIGFSGLAWITPLYVSLGKTSQEAANMFVLFQVVQLLTMLTLPALSDRTRDRRPLLGFVVASTVIGISMLLIDPVGLAIPCMTLFGMGVGGGSTLGLVLIVDVTSTQADAARLGAMTLLVAFLAGAMGPFVMGVLRDLTGGFVAGYSVMLALSVAMLLAVVAYRPGRTIHDQRPRAADSA